MMTTDKPRLRVIVHLWWRSLELPGRYQYYDKRAGDWAWTCDLKTVRRYAARLGYGELLNMQPR